MTVTDGPAVVVEREDAVVFLTLNRPEVLNAYNREMRDQLYAALEFVAADASVQVMVVRGAGRAFGSGGDLTEFGLAESPLAARETRAQRDVWGLWSTLPCLSLAAVHGIASGGGMEMALLCDLVITVPTARYFLPETGLGTLPGVGGSQTLPRAMGLGPAGNVLLAGAEISGREALDLGLAQWLVPESALEGRMRAIAAAIAALPIETLRATRETLRRGGDLSLAEGLRLEARLSNQLRWSKS